MPLSEKQLDKMEALANTELFKLLVARLPKMKELAVKFGGKPSDYANHPEVQAIHLAPNTNTHRMLDGD